ncbi:MAG: competence/damage-inducible protein A [Chitinophagales bacterium]
MKAEILTIGDELLIGNTINTNAAWIAQQLNLIGIDVIHHLTLSDEKIDIINSIENALNTVDIIVITGGLGPTNDDITKYVLTDYFGGKLVFNEAAFQNIERLFAHRKKWINEATKKVAYLPDNCIPIQNKMGTAAGMLFTKDNKTIVSMPGVPYEMKAMMSDDFIPYLQKKYELPTILHKHILTAGVGETEIAEKLESFEHNLSKYLKLAYLPSLGSVKLRLTAKGNTAEKLQKIINDATEEIQSKLNEWIFGYDDETLESVIGKKLQSKNLMLGTAESCTGGMLAHKITSVAGSSAYFKGSIISYANEIKEDILGVQKKTLAKYGAVSEETVSEMLLGALKQLDVNIAVAISGIAGPDGGTKEKPVGTVFIGIANKEKQLIKKFSFYKNRAINIELSSVFALVQLRKFLNEYY